MIAFLAAALMLTPMAMPTMTPVRSDELAVGAAVYYSPSFDQGGWQAIVKLRQAWGQLPADFAMPAGAYYCAHPDHDIGTVVRVQNAITGAVIDCVVVDTVAPGDVAHWKAHAVIELSWAGFCAVDGRDVNRVVVTQEGGD